MTPGSAGSAPRLAASWCGPYNAALCTHTSVLAQHCQLLLLKNLFPRLAPLQVVGAGYGLDKHGLVELPAARCQEATAARCRGLVNLEFLHAIPPGPESLSPALLQLCHIQLDKQGGDNTAGF